MRRPPHSSGDLIADRRFAYAMDLAREGDAAAAIDLIEQAIERAPGWAAAWRELAKLRLARFDRDGAVAAFREALGLDPSDPFGCILELSRLGAALQVDAAPPAYVEALFDAYAADFDQALIERLEYSTPRALAALLRAAQPAGDGRRFPRALDLGCGTGLAGEALRADIAWLEGVDIAGGMVAVADKKGVYDRLARADILAALKEPGEPYDLIIAADVLIYTGDLSKIVAAMAARLAPGGLAAFSIEQGAGADWTVGESLRFAHAPDYILRLAAQAGLETLAAEVSALRKDRGADVDGVLFVLRKPQAVIASALPGTEALGDIEFVPNEPVPLLH
ncbi:MAG: methyltransferase domain-containing protein [Amphiplicatus sp.]